MLDRTAQEWERLRELPALLKAALETMRALACEPYPQWQDRFALVHGRLADAAC